jgi:hypothetical protein
MIFSTMGLPITTAPEKAEKMNPTQLMSIPLVSSSIGKNGRMIEKEEFT